MHKILQLICVISILCGHAVYADVLVLKNGDRITGEIKRIWDSEITIEPDYADDFKVDVEAVEHIESDRNFDIELKGGRSLLAQFDGADAEGNQIIRSVDETLGVPLAQLFELDEPEKDFDWEGHIDFSATVNDGNTDSFDSKLRADTTVDFPNHRHIAEITFIREEQDGDSNKEQDLFRYSYNWLFNDPWFLGTQLTYERDPIIELDRRVIGSVGIGLDVWNTPRRALSVQLGAGLQTEEIGMQSENSSVATWTLRYRHDFLGDDLELFHNHTITHNLSGRTNTSYKTSTGFRIEITDLFYANVSLDYDVETEPVDLAENDDTVLVIGIGAEF
jgi:putative salt-induced outer membrane protein YdiY